MTTFHRTAAIIAVIASLVAPSAVASERPNSVAPGLVAGVPERPMPPRAVQPWQELVAERRAAYAAEPWRFAAPKLEDLGTQVIAANEADPVEGVIYNWWCNPFNGPDESDFMWMFAIAVAVQSGAHPHVYLDTWAPYKGDLQQACSGMLLSNMGIPADRVSWYTDVPSEAFWVRDYGPFFVRDITDGDLSIEDAWYFPGRPNDDAMPVDFADRIDVPVSDFDLYFEGGNFLPNGGGLCLVSSVVRDANPHVDEPTLEQMFRLELGCENLVIVDALRDYATGHVDMWMAWVDHTTLLVGEYLPTQDPVNRSIIERNVRRKLEGLHDPATGDPITIVRVPMPSNCPADSGPGFAPAFVDPPAAPPVCAHVPLEDRIWRTYLNVLILNDTVMLPTYAQDRTHEAEAVAIWQSFGFNVVPIDADLLIPFSGAFHCVAKTIDAAP